MCDINFLKNVISGLGGVQRLNTATDVTVNRTEFHSSPDQIPQQQKNIKDFTMGDTLPPHRHIQ
jgi:hypothetical protein